ncbi:MAG TPA: hypothetical protein VIJ99_03980 [Acidimicrobiales bacterium]
MTPDLNVHSFDPPRERSAPDSLSGYWSNGTDAVMALTRLTLLVAIKPNCDGCRAFLDAPLHEFEGVDVVFVAALDDDEWAGSSRRVLIAPDALDRLDVRWPPFYVLIDPLAHAVIREGVVFGPSQVAAEIAQFITR